MRSKKGRRIEVYGAAYKLALAQIPPLTMRELPHIRLRIHASIRKQLNGGERNPLRIAFTAAKDASVADTDQ